MSRYGLPRDVFVAFDGPYSVWLNLRQDRYFALERSVTREFATLVQGWPRELDSTGAAAPRSESALPQMLQSGLLVDLDHETDVKDATPAVASELVGEVCVPVLAPAPRIRPHHVRNLACASISAASALKWRGLASAISRMRHRHARAPHRSATTDRLLELITAFAFLRPFFLASRDRCLMSTLALSEFLARYRAHPECVIGVHARPFGAHCWLEHENLVLNDTVERVQRYTPILRV